VAGAKAGVQAAPLSGGFNTHSLRTLREALQFAVTV
jgi:hypothetical protein